MVFEFDPERSESNKEKHGIDFSEAQVLWTTRMWLKYVLTQWMSHGIRLWAG